MAKEDPTTEDAGEAPKDVRDPAEDGGAKAASEPERDAAEGSDDPQEELPLDGFGDALREQGHAAWEAARSIVDGDLDARASIVDLILDPVDAQTRTREAVGEHAIGLGALGLAMMWLAAWLSLGEVVGPIRSGLGGLAIALSPALAAITESKIFGRARPASPILTDTGIALIPVAVGTFAAFLASGLGLAFVAGVIRAVALVAGALTFYGTIRGVWKLEGWRAVVATYIIAGLSVSFAGLAIKVLT